MVYPVAERTQLLATLDELHLALTQEQRRGEEALRREQWAMSKVDLSRRQLEHTTPTARTRNACDLGDDADFTRQAVTALKQQLVSLERHYRLLLNRHSRLEEEAKELKGYCSALEMEGTVPLQIMPSYFSQPWTHISVCCASARHSVASSTLPARNTAWTRQRHHIGPRIGHIFGLATVKTGRRLVQRPGLCQQVPMGRRTTVRRPSRPQAKGTRN